MCALCLHCGCVVCCGACCVLSFVRVMFVFGVLVHCVACCVLRCVLRCVLCLWCGAYCGWYGPFFLCMVVGCLL